MEKSREHAAAIDQLKTELALLAQEFEYERKAWRQALESQVTEFRHLVKRQDETQDQQISIAGGAFELGEKFRLEIGELTEQARFVQAQLERISMQQEEQQDATSCLEAEVRDLSLLTYEVYDDLAQRVDAHEQQLGQIGSSLHQQKQVLERGMASVQEFLTEGLVEATDAANQHTDAIIELKQAVAEAMHSNDAMQEAIGKRQETLQEHMFSQTKGLHSRIEELASQLAERQGELAERQLDATKIHQALQSRLGDLQLETLKHQQAHAVQLNELAADVTRRLGSLGSDMTERLRSQGERHEGMQDWLKHFQDTVREEVDQVQLSLNQLAVQGQDLLIAIDSVQQGAISAEQQAATWVLGQLEAFRASQEALQQIVDLSHADARSLQSQTHQQLKTLESKTVQALTHQHHEKLEHDRQIAALRDEYSQLSNRVGSILQLLMNNHRVSPGSPTLP